MDVSGRVLVPLDRAALRRLKVGDVAVCFLHSYANPKHEREAGRILKSHLSESGAGSIRRPRRARQAAKARNRWAHASGGSGS